LSNTFRYGVLPYLTRSETIKSKVRRAAEVVQEALNREDGSLYGVTTGVGASGPLSPFRLSVQTLTLVPAFTRTREVNELQRALVNKNLNGIVPSLSTFLTNPQLGLLLPEDVMKGTVLVRKDFALYELSLPRSTTPGSSKLSY
jgi:phenylalanine ammonia-lyase